MKLFSIFLIFLLLTFSSSFLSLAQAADIRGKDTIILSKDEKNLTDLYLFGKNITIEAPVTNDLIAAGGDIIIDSEISGNIFAAGGTLRIKGKSSGSVRVAGGNIVIDGYVGRDLLIGGGNVLIAKTATIAGDLLVAGGELVIRGDVNGKTIINGENVYIEGKFGKQVEGNAGQFHIGPKAVIGGNFTYSSPEKAIIEKGAVIIGTTQYTHLEQKGGTEKQVRGLFKVFSFYKLFGDIILSVLFVIFLGKYIQVNISRITNRPFRNFTRGLAFLLLMPLMSLILLALIFPGIASFLFYFLVLIFSVYLAKIFIGWIILSWWYKRSGKIYILDWKSGITGPIALFLVALIPVFGWVFIVILYIINIGAFIQEFTEIIRTQRIGEKTRR